MKKILLLLLLIGITGLSYGDSVDDWSDDRLCGWMENPPPHSYMVEEEVKKRSISCSGRVAINNLSDSLDLATNDLIGGVSRNKYSVSLYFYFQSIPLPLLIVKMSPDYKMNL